MRAELEKIESAMADLRRSLEETPCSQTGLYTGVITEVGSVKTQIEKSERHVYNAVIESRNDIFEAMEIHVMFFIGMLLGMIVLFAQFMAEYRVKQGKMSCALNDILDRLDCIDL